MPRRSFGDRLLKPLPVVLAVVGAGVGFAVAGPIAAVAAAVVAWGGGAAVLPPPAPPRPRMDPFTLGEPWRHAVRDALQAQTRFRAVVRDAQAGPLRERLEDIGRRIDHGVEEAWRAAKQGQALVEARKRIDAGKAQRELAAAEADEREAGGLVDALRAQVASAERLDRTIADARDRLRVTNARLDEAAARAAELSVAAHDVAELRGLGDDVESLVHDLEALRLGLEEVGRPGLGTG